ncbi:MAG: diguanylate cyclase [Sphingomonadales bacterium]|nr:diguanylate cyclase [Sphingomonadales bacterium]MBD3772434.1 diguanylate cyclase [Paracoccaceae bacterium]
MSAGDPQMAPTIRQVFAKGHVQLVLLAVALAAIGMTVSGSLLLRGYEFINLQLASRSIAYSVEPAVYFEDRRGVAQAIAFVADIETIESVRVADAQGNVLAEWGREGPAQDSALAGLVARWVQPEPYNAPIMHDGQPIGSVTIRSNSVGLVRFAYSSFLIALCCLGITLVATRVFTRKLREAVVVPLEQVAEIADDVRVARNFSRRLPTTGIAEIDSFGQGFNALLGELQRWHASLTDENEVLAHRAEHDPLTGLGNRTKLERMLHGAVANAEELEATFALLYIDLDRFKAINDEFGHAAGDQVLMDFADRLRSSVRGRDQIFRLGGDEFAILLDPARERLQAHHVTARIQAAMLPPVILGSDRRVPISCSIGAAVYPDDGTSVEALLKRADSEMYQEKRGRSDEK